MAEDDCRICDKKPAKYSCPRCNVLYCSVDCYKSQQHLECSEGFFRENVVQELALRQKEDEVKESSKAMVEILRRVELADSLDGEEDEALSDNPDEETPDSDDEDQDFELADRLNGVDLDDPSSVWERLTGAEKEEFQSLVENGDIIKILPSLNCWWTQEHKVDLIQPVDGTSAQEKQLLSACPRVWDKIPNFADLFNKEPSPTVRFNIANVLAAYSFVYRYFYGDMHGNALEAADCLIGIALNLKKNAVFDSEAMAVESVTSECLVEKLPTDNTTTSVLKDHKESMRI
ncbi:AGAP001270-PA-like protein [Anopheles sinensis]|uniref:AGAP001270-PA-like protein n=1 Tax=Anopheles sinensis TaxID=74873 RepID=A0A084W0L5_ANOSI|nr:AGAP001270-PA-like protein [Anopheles sinensis]